MPVILLEKDPFVELENELAADPYQQNFNVRRPLYGYNEKWVTQPRFAFLSIYPQTGGQPGVTAVSLLDSSAPGGWSDANHNFILQAVQEVRNEKVQIVETFGDHYAFFYGERPIVLQCSGMLFNMPDFNWKNEWLANYERFLRGTRCVENKTRVFLGYDDVLAQGYILNTQISIDKDMPNVCPFSFSMLLTAPPRDLSRATVREFDETRIYSSLSALAAQQAAAEAAGGTSVNPQGSTQRALDEGHVEYLTDIENEIKSGVKKIDPVTGELIFESGSNKNPPGSNVSERTAFWITDKLVPTQQWLDSNKALFYLESTLAADQAGVDDLTATLALRADPSEFPLEKVGSDLAASLEKGVVNTAAVVGDAPVLG